MLKRHQALLYKPANPMREKETLSKLSMIEITALKNMKNHRAMELVCGTVEMRINDLG